MYVSGLRNVPRHASRECTEPRRVNFCTRRRVCVYIGVGRRRDVLTHVFVIEDPPMDPKLSVTVHEHRRCFRRCRSELIFFDRYNRRLN